MNGCSAEHRKRELQMANVRVWLRSTCPRTTYLPHDTSDRLTTMYVSITLSDQ